jgi:hypothetical protein
MEWNVDRQCSGNGCTGTQIGRPITDTDLFGSSGNYVPAILTPGAPAPDQEETIRFVLDTDRRLDAKIGSSQSMSEMEISLWSAILQHERLHPVSLLWERWAGSYMLTHSV